MDFLKKNGILVAAGIIGVIAIMFVLKPGNKEKAVSKDYSISQSKENESNEVVFNKEGSFIISVDEITEIASFYEYEVEGTTVSFFAVKANDGTVRTAFNTCQICNGSPYAYFTQEGDVFTCNNCGNRYSLDMIEQERGGCNPIPISSSEKSVTENEILIKEELLEENVDLFKNWKKF